MNFEIHVQAAFTVLMLTGRVAPCLPPWPITKLKMQGRYLGFNTDDFIVFTKDLQTGKEAKLLAQIKHSLAVTEGDETFGEVIQAAWADFNNPDVFCNGFDVFALITGPLSTNDIKNVRSLLEWARHSEDETDFVNKVSLANFCNDSKRSKLNIFRSHLKRANNGIEVTDKQLWHFLKSFYLIGYDLDTESSSTLSLLQSLLSQYSSENSFLLWTRIVETVRVYNQNAGTIRKDNIPEDIRQAFNFKENTMLDYDIGKLTIHSNYIIEGIRSDIGGVKVCRPDSLKQLLDISEEAEFIFLSGERGCGKSSLVKDFVQYMKDRAPIFCLRTEDLDKAHLDNVFSAIGLTSTLSELEAGFALMNTKYLLIESIEKLLELHHNNAFIDLLQFVQKHPGWKLIATGRDYAYQAISFNFLRPFKVHFSTLMIKGFNNEEIQFLCEKLENLRSLFDNPSLKPLLNNPFFASLAYRVVETGAQFLESDGEAEFRAAVWREVISNEKERSHGMPIKRKRAFIEIAVNRAKKMVYGVPCDDFDAEVILKLEEDNLIRREASTGLVSPAHDVFEDWALERYIEDNFQNYPDDVQSFLEKTGHEPAMGRAFRLWLCQKMQYEENISDLILSILANKEIERCWQDETISAILLNDNNAEFINELNERLFINDGELLKRFCFILRIVCKMPDQEMSDIIGMLYLNPYGKGWSDIIRFLWANKNNVSRQLLPHITAVLYEWSSLVQIGKELPESAREAGLMSIHLLDMIKDVYRDEDYREKLLNIIIKVVPAISNEFNGMLEADVFNSDEEGHRLAYVSDFCNKALTDIDATFLCKYMPETIIRLAFHDWLIDERREKRNRYYRSHSDVEECFGLYKYRSGGKFFPPSGAKGLFGPLLQYHPRKGLDFIIRLLNITAEKYAKSDLDLPDRYSEFPFLSLQSELDQVEIPLNDGIIIKQYCSARLWLGYRGHSVMPDLLQSALMALENWLIDLLESSVDEKTLERIYDYILRNSNSVMATSVLASVATGFLEKLSTAIIPLLKTSDLYELDLVRTIHEHGEREIDWHKMAFTESFKDIYSQERRKAALRPWRKDSLESVIVRLQFTEKRNEVLSIIDELRAKISNDENWRFRFHRIDSRDWEPVEDKENNRIIFNAKNLEPDLEEIQQKTQEEHALNNRFITLTLWAEKILGNDILESNYYADWRDALGEAKSLSQLVQDSAVTELGTMHRGGIVKAATIFLRDHSTEMDKEEWAWCIELVFNTILCNADARDKSIALDKTDYDGTAAAALVLPIIFDIAENIEEKIAIKEVIVIALTHVNEAVRTQTAIGIRRYMWQRDSAFALECIAGVIEYSRLKLEENRKRIHRGWQASSNDGINQNLPEKWLSDFRDKLACGEVPQADILKISFQTHCSDILLCACLMIPNRSTEPMFVLLLSQFLSLLFEAEGMDNSDRDKNNIDIQYDISMNFSKRFAEYLFSLSDPEFNLFIDQLRMGCDRAPQFISWLLINLDAYSERAGNKEPYWRLWGQLSSKVQEIAKSLATNYDKYTRQDNKTKLIRYMLYADTPWQKIDYEKQDIILGKNLIIDFIANTGMNPDVFAAMASLMYHFPGIFFSSGLQILSKYQKEMDEMKLISKKATIYLERSIQRFLLTDNTEPLKKDIHKSCWILLDAIIETGSSIAYYLREHLIRSRRIVKGI